MHLLSIQGLDPVIDLITSLSVIVRVSVLRGLVFPIIDQQPEQKNNNKRDNKA